MNQINRINTDAREATATAAREHAAAAEIGRTLERLGLEADAARIGAENADAACLAARVAVAECDERSTTDASTFAFPHHRLPEVAAGSTTMRRSGSRSRPAAPRGSSGCCAATVRR